MTKNFLYTNNSKHVLIGFNVKTKQKTLKNEIKVLIALEAIENRDLLSFARTIESSEDVFLLLPIQVFDGLNLPRSLNQMIQTLIISDNLSFKLLEHLSLKPKSELEAILVQNPFDNNQPVDNINIVKQQLNKRKMQTFANQLILMGTGLLTGLISFENPEPSFELEETFQETVPTANERSCLVEPSIEIEVDTKMLEETVEMETNEIEIQPEAKAEENSRKQLIEMEIDQKLIQPETKDGNNSPSNSESAGGSNPTQELNSEQSKQKRSTSDSSIDYLKNLKPVKIPRLFPEAPQ